ncbi:Hpt domain-containing protein [Polaribacter uvawellassae]|uniref:Hpt domain-containing protein n=1 Tax=Polaribacter uvawellassae TaxID=3133495 RepID=UPI003219CAF5
MNEKPNLDYVHEIANGDIAFQILLIKTIKEETQLEVAEYKKFLEIKEFIKASEIVHKLVHKISILGLEKSCVLAKKHEEALKEKNAAMQTEFQTIIQKMSDFLNDK